MYDIHFLLFYNKMNNDYKKEKYFMIFYLFVSLRNFFFLFIILFVDEKDRILRK
jgi:hypothetical protein